MIEHMFGSVDLDGVTEACRKAAGVDASMVSDDELTVAVVEVERARRALDACSAHVSAELDARKVCDRRFGLATGRWVERETCGSSAEVRRRIMVGERLARWFPVLDAALAAGDLSFPHVELVCRLAIPRIAAELSAFDEHLVDLARSASFDRFAAEVRMIAGLLDADGGHDPREKASELDLIPTPDGCRVDGDLDEHDALVATGVIDALADELRLRFVREREHGVPVEVPSLRRLRAMALVELCRRGRAVDVDASTGPVADVTLVISDHDQHGVGRCGAVARGPDGRALSERVASLLSCDATFSTLLVDGDGVPLRLGRAQRRASAHQRRVLAHRDGGCVFPGCNAKASWCDAHHVVHWRLGGATDLANLVLLCRYHHGVVHRSGWTMTADGGGGQTFTITTPTGERMRARGHPPPGRAARALQVQVNADSARHAPG